MRGLGAAGNLPRRRRWKLRRRVRLAVEHAAARVVPQAIAGRRARRARLDADYRQPHGERVGSRNWRYRRCHRDSRPPAAPQPRHHEPRRQVSSTRETALGTDPSALHRQGIGEVDLNHGVDSACRLGVKTKRRLTLRSASALAAQRKTRHCAHRRVRLMSAWSKVTVELKPRGLYAPFAVRGATEVR